jgi:hypothetical protein
MKRVKLNTAEMDKEHGATTRIGDDIKRETE